jgi:hypothetical protein
MIVKKRLSFQDILLSHFGVGIYPSSFSPSGECAVVANSLDVEYLRNTGILTLKSRDLEDELSTAHEKVLEYSTLVVDLEEKADVLKVQNDKLKKGTRSNAIFTLKPASNLIYLQS